MREILMNIFSHFPWTQTFRNVMGILPVTFEITDLFPPSLVACTVTVIFYLILFRLASSVFFFLALPHFILSCALVCVSVKQGFIISLFVCFVLFRGIFLYKVPCKDILLFYYHFEFDCLIPVSL